MRWSLLKLFACLLASLLPASASLPLRANLKVTNSLTLNLPLSVTLLYDANGNLTDRMEYSAYGMLSYRSWTNDTPFLYNGRYGVQTDANGLLYMRARYYNPYVCRFLNADPLGFGGGLNWYAYAAGNPVTYLDPFGLGAMGSGVNSWLAGSSISDLMYNNSPSGQNFQAYYQTMAGMQQFAGFQQLGSPGQGASDFLNALPAVGGLKTWAEHGFTGRDLITGQRVEDLTLFTAAGIVASFTPFSLETAPERIAAKGLGKYEVGSYNVLRDGAAAGLDAHHVGQKALMRQFIKGYDPITAPSILVPNAGHTIGEGVVSRNMGGFNSARDVIARDIRELRRVYPDIPNGQLQRLIKMNKQMYPEVRR